MISLAIALFFQPESPAVTVFHAASSYAVHCGIAEMLRSTMYFSNSFSIVHGVCDASCIIAVVGDLVDVSMRCWEMAR